MIDNGDATAEEIRDEKAKVEEALTALNQAKDDLKQIKQITTKTSRIKSCGITEGKKPASVTAYNNEI